MEPIFDPEGTTVAWRSKETVFDLDGTPRAYFRAGLLYSYTGAFIGHYSDGFYRDLDGHAVAFHADATGGPSLPLTRPEPVAPVPVYPRAPQKLDPAPPPARMRSRKWSNISWAKYVAVATPVAR